MLPVAYASPWRIFLPQDLHFEPDGDAGNLRQFLNSFLMFYDTMWPYVLPPLFAIALESPLSLRTWVAVQKAKIPGRADASPRRIYLQKLHKHALTHLVPVYLLFVSFVVSYLQCMACISPERLQVVEVVLFGPLFWFATTRLFGLLSRIYTLSVRRDADGDPLLIRTIRPSVPRIFMIIPISLGLLATYGAIIRDDRVCKAVVHAALLHVFIAANARSREGIRAAGVYALTNIVTLITLAFYLALHSGRVRFLMNSTESPAYPEWEEFVSSSRLESDGEGDHEYNHDSAIDDPNGYRWPLFALAVLWNIFPVELVALCYRFDYARFARKNGFDFLRTGEQANTSNEETINSRPPLTHDMLLDNATRREKTSNFGPIFLTPETPDAFYSGLPPHPAPCPSHSPSNIDISKKPRENDDVRLPSSLSLPSPSSIPFAAFLTSLTAYLASTVILSALFYITIGEHREDALTYVAPLLPLVTLPLATFAVPVGLAFMDKGEDVVKELWRYEELWRLDVRRTGGSNQLE